MVWHEMKVLQHFTAIIHLDFEQAGVFVELCTILKDITFPQGKQLSTTTRGECACSLSDDL